MKIIRWDETEVSVDDPEDGGINVHIDAPDGQVIRFFVNDELIDTHTAAAHRTGSAQ